MLFETYISLILAPIVGVRKSVYFRRTFLGAMFCLLLIGGLSAQTTPPKQVSPEVQLDKDDEIKIDTLLIDVPVSVVDSDGKFVAGLRKDNFQIFENGVSQKIEYFASVEQPFTVVLLLDVSGSMHNNLDDIKAAALSFIDKLNPSDRHRRNCFRSAFESAE